MGAGAELCSVTRVEEQRGDELQQTVLMGSASSALELPATSCSSSALTSSCSTASTMGMTMAVVDVLESHMDSSVVQHMKQSSSLEGREARGVHHSVPASPGETSALTRLPRGLLQACWCWHLSRKWGVYVIHSALYSQGLLQSKH